MRNVDFLSDKAYIPQAAELCQNLGGSLQWREGPFTLRNDSRIRV